MDFLPFWNLYFRLTLKKLVVKYVVEVYRKGTELSKLNTFITNTLKVYNTRLVSYIRCYFSFVDLHELRPLKLFQKKSEVFQTIDL